MVQVDPGFEDKTRSLPEPEPARWRGRWLRPGSNSTTNDQVTPIVARGECLIQARQKARSDMPQTHRFNSGFQTLDPQNTRFAHLSYHRAFLSDLRSRVRLLPDPMALCTSRGHAREERLEALPIEADADSGRPRVVVGARPRIIASDCAIAPPSSRRTVRRCTGSRRPLVES